MKKETPMLNNWLKCDVEHRLAKEQVDPMKANGNYDSMLILKLIGFSIFLLLQ